MEEKRKKHYISDNAVLIEEWDWDLNNELGFDPHTISYGSAKKVWWKCKDGHKWEASPNHRSRGRGCPECAQIQRVITKRKNIVAHRGSLADNNPILAGQWHPTKNGNLFPGDVSVNSAMRVWWVCEKGHEWDAPINSRNSGVGCPICSGHKLVVGVNDLMTIKPDIAAQWHPTKNGKNKASDVIAGTDKTVWWQCEKGHAWQARINNRINGNNCPICSGKKVLPGYNDLATVMPQVASEWHLTKNGYMTARSVTIGSNKKIWWQCDKGHEWQTTVSHRCLRGTKCPVCFGESKTSFPEQAIFFYLRQVTEAYNRYMLDNHTEIDIYLPIFKIGIEYDGAYFHEGEKSALREKRKYESLNKHGISLIRVREIAEPNKENTIFSKPGANDVELSQTIKDLCMYLGRKINKSINIDVDITRDRSKIYEQYILTEKEHSLAVVNPKLAAEWHPTLNGSLLPQNVTAGSNKKVWWKCSEGHEWEAAIASRNKGHNCSKCAKRSKKS